MLDDQCDIELECIDMSDAECAFNHSLLRLRSSFCLPLVAMVYNLSINVFVAKCILLMLVSPYKLIHSSRVFGINGSNGRKLIDMFDKIVFPRLQDDEEDV